MPTSKSRKKKSPKRVLALPDLEHARWSGDGVVSREPLWHFTCAPQTGFEEISSKRTYGPPGCRDSTSGLRVIHYLSLRGVLCIITPAFQSDKPSVSRGHSRGEESAHLCQPLGNDNSAWEPTSVFQRGLCVCLS